MKHLLQKMPITVKLAFCVVSLIGSELMVARTLGLIENHDNIVMNGRSDLCEAVAIHFSLMAMREDVSTMQKCLHAISVRNDSIESIGVRQAKFSWKLATTLRTGRPRKMGDPPRHP
jgi:hypothetical protein